MAHIRQEEATRCQQHDRYANHYFIISVYSSTISSNNSVVNTASQWKASFGWFTLFRSVPKVGKICFTESARPASNPGYPHVRAKPAVLSLCHGDILPICYAVLLRSRHEVSESLLLSIYSFYYLIRWLFECWCNTFHTINRTWHDECTLCMEPAKQGCYCYHILKVTVLSSAQASGWKHCSLS